MQWFTISLVPCWSTIYTLVQYVHWYTIFLVPGWSTISSMYFGTISAKVYNILGIWLVNNVYFGALVHNILCIWLANMYILWYNIWNGTQYSWYLEHYVDHNTDSGEKLTPDPQSMTRWYLLGHDDNHALASHICMSSVLNMWSLMSLRGQRLRQRM